MAWRLNFSTWRRFNVDLHTVSGIYSLVLVLVMALTGVVLTFEAPANWIRSWTHTPAAPAIPTSVARKGVPPIAPDTALASAKAVFPEALITGIGLPLGPRAAYQVSMKFPEDKTPGGRSAVWIDQFSGQLLLKQSSREAPAGVKIMNMIRPLHRGDLYGWPSRLAWFAACVAVGVQVVTGVLIWWLRRRGQAHRIAAGRSGRGAAANA